MVAVCLENITRRFGDTVALDSVSLEFPEGTFTALLGPSGCGKTTLLRLIAGFEKPDDGRVLFDGQVVADGAFCQPPEKRGVGVVFQSYALWPHMDVAGNVAYPLTMRGVPRREKEQRIQAVLATVGLEGYGQRRIDELSGGQRQRVALARCLVADCRVILFDEPLANLDMHLRASMVEAFREIHQRTGATMIYVTHDQAEALALADRIAVMDRGNVLQVTSPAEVYRAPRHGKVASFVGRGAVLRGDIVSAEDDRALVDISGYRFTARCAAAEAPARMNVLLRPEGLRLSREGDGMRGRVAFVIYKGPVFEVQVALPGRAETLLLDSVEPPIVGADVAVSVIDAWVLPA